MVASAILRNSQLPDNIPVKPSCPISASQLHNKTVPATISPITGNQLVYVLGNKCPVRKTAIYIQKICKL